MRMRGCQEAVNHVPDPPGRCKSVTCLLHGIWLLVLSVLLKSLGGRLHKMAYLFQQDVDINDI